MVAAHFHVELTDCSVERNISVLFVHVMNSGSRLISEHNSECFNVVGSLLKNLIDREDLSLSTLGLELLPQMVPEFRFGDNLIASEEANGIDFGIRVLLSGEFPSHHQVLPDFHLERGILGVLGTFLGDFNHPIYYYYLKLNIQFLAHRSIKSHLKVVIVKPDPN